MVTVPPRLAALAALLALPCTPLFAQSSVVGGIAVDLKSARPLACLSVELLDSAGRVVASTRTRLGGDFEFPAPSRGEYRFRFTGLGIAQVETIAEPLDPSSDIERIFRVGLALLDISGRAQQIAGRDKSELPQFLPGRGVPRYPDELRMKSIVGEAIVGYAVTEEGKVDPKSVLPIHTSHPDFLRAVERSLPDQRFTPARTSGQATCMFRVGTYVFRLNGLIGHIEID